MNINRAKGLKVGDKVFCPADRGIQAHLGRVLNVGTVVTRRLDGDEYLWIETEWVGSDGRKEVWPSSRLSMP